MTEPFIDHPHWCLGCDTSWMHPDEDCTEEAARGLSQFVSFKLCPPCEAPLDYHEASNEP